jgi:hypothetical protein
LRIKGDNLPEPLAVKHSAGLLETQAVYVVGFPFGENLGTNITVSQTTISSLRKSPTGEMTQVQVNGGMHQGNSGGPVVTANGEVIGVAVAIIQGTQINFAVPGESVQLMMNGRLTTLTGGGTLKDGNQVKMPVTVRIADPLKRLQKIRLAWWVGNKGQQRPPSDETPMAAPGDSPHQVVDMAVQGDQARYELVLPADLKPGQMIWVQPVVANKAGRERWASAVSYVPSMPAEKLPAMLALKPMWGARPLAVSSTARMTLVLPGQKTDTEDTSITALMTETMTSEVNNAASLRWRYQKYTYLWPPNMAFPGAQVDHLKKALPHIGGLHAEMFVDATNKISRDDVDLSASKTPDETQRVLTNIHSEVQKSLELLSIPLPGRECQPGETWRADRSLQIPHLPTGSAEMTYTYRGVRQRDGRPEAVISIKGFCSDLGGKPTTGKIKGTAYLDLTCFQIAQTHTTADLELHAGMQGKVTIKLESKMDRTLGKEVLNVRDQLTVNDPVDAKRCPYKIHNVQLEAGKPCVVSLESFKGAGWFDTFVRIEDSSGKVLAQDDNRGVDLNSLVVFTPAQSGQVRIVATTLQPKMGNYLLVVRQ